MSNINCHIKNLRFECPTCSKEGDQVENSPELLEEQGFLSYPHPHGSLNSSGKELCPLCPHNGALYPFNGNEIYLVTFDTEEALKDH